MSIKVKPKKNLIGKRFGRLVVVKQSDDHVSPSGYRFVKWLCECDCGKTSRVHQSSLVGNLTTSCGCVNSEGASKRFKKHGMSNSSLSRLLYNIITRCENENTWNYKNYGGRGVKVCSEWRNNPTEFFRWALSNGYREGLQIDRINNNGNYEPLNCRFTTSHINACNKRKQRNNKSGYIGVSWSKQKKKWVASITINRKGYHIGLYTNKHDAVEARNKYIIDRNLTEYKVQNIDFITRMEG